MSRSFQIIGVAALIFCALKLYGSLEESVRSVADEPPALLDAIGRALDDAGLHQRDDVSIEMNRRKVALGFSRPGCDGLMLVSVLPYTAQGWAHMAPRLDLSAYQVAFVYGGAHFPSVPRLERLAGRLRGDLGPQRTESFPQVVATAETGGCSLAKSAAGVLEAVSRGQALPAGDSQSTSGKGDVFL